MATLDTKLKNGDVVEIITDKNRKGPSRDWLKFVKTKSAKERINSALRKQQQFNIVNWLINKN
jgi:GTP pyrophosphokinase